MVRQFSTVEALLMADIGGGGGYQNLAGTQNICAFLAGKAGLCQLKYVLNPHTGNLIITRRLAYRVAALTSRAPFIFNSLLK